METTTRCSNHKTRATLPRLCHTCQRIDIERELVMMTVEALLNAGYALGTDAEGENEKPITRDSREMRRRLMEVDDEHLLVYVARAFGKTAESEEAVGWVRFVYGNDGYDVISDYTTNLALVIAPVQAHADTLN